MTIKLSNQRDAYANMLHEAAAQLINKILDFAFLKRLRISYKQNAKSVYNVQYIHTVE